MISLRRFGLTFVLLFAVLAGAFEASRGTAFERVVVDDLILVPTVVLINAVMPGDRVELTGRTLVSNSGDTRLHVTRGCEGIDLLLLLDAAIGAFPASLVQKVRGLAVGSLLAYALSVGRLMVLDYVLRYAAGAWESMHGLIMPLVPVIFLALYFLRWSAGAAVNHPLDARHHAA